ncbi:LamG domain-containing protein [Halorussus pelagicus]|uniref:LamG domain-containing protein n=1 Tax=Halorussus pelagicus TaxID=2505977 RepID=UPI000FFC3DE0|nr:LamG domain-containing protein [Halorussus pelagicus]
MSGSGVQYTDGQQGSNAAAWPGFVSADFVPLENDEPLTFCYWMRDDGTESTWDDDLIWKITSEDGGGVGSFCTTDGDAFLWSSGDNTLNQSTTNVLDGRWHHVAFVYEQSRNRLQLFIDGNREYDIEYTDNLTGMDRTAIMFGNNGSDGWKEYDGGVDDFRIYRRALSASEIRELTRA